MAAIVKAIDVPLRGEPAVLAVAWALAGLALLRSRRAGAAAVALVAFGSTLLHDPSNHTTLIGWTATMFAMFDGQDLRDVVRVQAVVLYLFASAHKLVGGQFLTGYQITVETWWSSAPAQLMAVGALGTQLALAWLVWRRDRLAAPLALALHGGIVLLVSSSGPQLLRLVMFNGLAVLLVWIATRRVDGLTEHE